MATWLGSEVVTVPEQQQAWEPLPGWYLDPADGRQLRFWDGSQWTQQVRPAKTRVGRPRALLIIGGVVAAVAVLVGVLVGVLALAGRVEQHFVRPGLAKTLDQIVVPAELRLISEDYWGNWLCFDTCPTLTRRYSSPLPREETYRVFVAELERLGYQCVPRSGTVDGCAWMQPEKGKQAPELYLDVRYTTDLQDRYGAPDPKDTSRPVHADLSVQ